jgi:hypothetical protein
VSTYFSSAQLVKDVSKEHTSTLFSKASLKYEAISLLSVQFTIYFCTTVFVCLTISNPSFLPPAYSPALIYCGRERGWWVTCNYPTVLKEKNRNRKSTSCAVCWLKSVLHEEKHLEQENHDVGRSWEAQQTEP